MKPKRRYREHVPALFIAVASANHRIHDFLKGWGTISKDSKSILWDHWRPCTKKQLARFNKITFDKFLFPAINEVASELSPKDICLVQPLGAALTAEVFHEIRALSAPMMACIVQEVCSVQPMPDNVLKPLFTPDK